MILRNPYMKHLLAGKALESVTDLRMPTSPWAYFLAGPATQVQVGGQEQTPR